MWLRYRIKWLFQKLKFADNLDVIAKELTVLSKECSDKANAIRDHIAQAKEDKHLIQDIVFETLLKMQKSVMKLQRYALLSITLPRILYTHVTFA